MTIPAGLGGWGDLAFWTTDWPRLQRALRSETRPVFPPPAAMFRALSLCPPNAVRVVILGQDPYHTPGKADGLAFSIPNGFGGRLDSLGNIFNEIQTDTGQTRTRTDLTDWAEQGVLLLNTALSVPQGVAQGHGGLGWHRLVAQVLDRLDPAPRAFLLWGGPAQEYGSALGGHHLVLRCAHPSPLSAHRGFFGSRPFSQTSEWLATHGQAPIHWGDPADTLPLFIDPHQG